MSWNYNVKNIKIFRVLEWAPNFEIYKFILSFLIYSAPVESKPRM